MNYPIDTQLDAPATVTTYREALEVFAAFRAGQHVFHIDKRSKSISKVRIVLVQVTADLDNQVRTQYFCEDEAGVDRNRSWQSDEVLFTTLEGAAAVLWS